MTSLSVANSLATVFVPIGVLGAGLAVVCAIFAAVALARGAVGLSGGAVGVWIACAMLSSASSFANEWMPLLVSLGALAAALVLGGAVRAVLRMTRQTRHAA